VSEPRQCPECGCDRWRARDADRTSERLRQKARDAEELARANGLLRYQLAEAQAGVKEVQSRLQRKIIRQARVIRRMEERLRHAGRKPYEGAPLGESAPGVEYDADAV
jgi:hypothetical protein